MSNKAALSLAAALIMTPVLYSIGSRRYKWDQIQVQHRKESGSVKHSTNRILITHVGSLPRPADLLEMNDAKVSGRPVDQAAWTARVKAAILEVVHRQRDSGVDIVNDGELSKSSWSSYVNERLNGFAESVSRGQSSLAKGRDRRAFQEFYDEYDRIQPFRTVNGSRWTDLVCNAPISYMGQAAVQMDIENLQAAAAGVGAEEAFITAVAPGSIITRRVNKYYSSEEAFLFAIAEAMKTEYQAIVAGGFLLQIDDPQLVTRYDMEDPPPMPSNTESSPRLESKRLI